jgi:outer membrane biosynthesis protein TonB
MALELRFTIPGQVERMIPMDQPHIKIGALLSNQIVLRAPGVDPIHALIEEMNEGEFFITDLGSATGVKVNGRIIDVEQRINDGDELVVGSVVIKVYPAAKPAPINATMPPPPPGIPEARNAATVRVTDTEAAYRRGEPAQAEKKPDRKEDMLFSPRKARPAGDVLECVAYWGDTVLDVELFHPTYKGFESVTIGDPTKAHLIAAGKSHIDNYTLASIKADGFKIHLRDGMYARLRRGGKVEKVTDAGTISLTSKDIAHLKYGAVSYFLMFVRPPTLDLPKSGPTDPFLLGLSAVAMLLYLILVPVAWLHQAAPVQSDKDDIWQIVQVPEKDQKPEEEKKKPDPPPKKPEVKVAEMKTPPKVPPKPKQQPVVKPAPTVEKEKPKQEKAVEKPVPQQKPTEMLTETKVAQKTPPTPTKQTPTEAKPEGPASDANKPPGDISKLAGVGMPSTGASKPDFKLAGPSLPNTALGKSGGVIGSGMNQKGGAIKGVGKADYKGVEGVNNNKASGVNLSKLGLGVGKIMSKTGAGAISTNFKDSAGGAGGGMGSASKTYGLGGVGSGRSLGLAGSGGAVNNFGSGSGGLLSGQGGSGGAGGNGLSGAFGGGGGGGGAGGRGRANVTVPAGDPVVSGGLTAQEIMAVIRANLNQIRHCYEQLLQRSPSASGKMSVMFVINTSGRIQTVNVTDSSISDSVMRGCVTGKIQRWAFPKPRGGQPVTVNYPFVFNPL